MSRTRIDRAALLTGARSRVETQGVNPLLPTARAELLTLDDIPDPYVGPLGGMGDLTPSERTHLDTCEQAIRTFHAAGWVAGKALATINRARLYRETHATFEEYLADRWEMSRPHAYRLIEAWPLVKRLSPTGDKTRAVPESHVRELLPAAKALGEDAAVALYEETRSSVPKVTAAVIGSLVKDLPNRVPPGEEPVTYVREHTRRLLRPAPERHQPEPEPVDAPEAVQAVADLQKAVAALRAVGKDLRRQVYDAVRADPVIGRELADEVHKVAAAIAANARKDAERIAR